MKLKTVFRGSDFPFEGERLLLLQTLPKGAKVHSATAIIRPVKAAGMNDLFVEKISFDNGSGDWGATKISASDWFEIDFHARRTLHTVTGKSFVQECTLEVDLGGLFVSIADDGTVYVPDQTKLKLNLNPDSEETLPGLTVTKFKITKTSSFPDIKELKVKSTPANVSLNFNYEPPFWTSSGEMTGAETIPDFAEALQAYLEKAETKNGYIVLPFVLHSDSIARLDLEIEIEYSKQVDMLPEAVTEVQVPFDYASLPNQEQGLLTASLPPGAKVIPKLTTAKVIGAFKESRVVFGKTGFVEAKALVPIKGGLSQAQFIKVEKETPVTAFDILVAAVSRKVSLDINILPDSDGKPFDDPLLAEPVKLNLDRETAGSLSWISVNLYREFLFKPQENYWLVIHALEGEAVWGADPAPGNAIPLQFTDSGGLSWRDTVMQDISGPLAAHFRLRHTPARYQVPIELQIGEGELARRVSLERFQPLGRVDFNLDFDEVADAFNQYLQDKTPDALKEAEHLENGDFEEWIRINDEIRKISSVSLRPSEPEEQREPAAVKVSPYGATIFVASNLYDNYGVHERLKLNQSSIGYLQIFDFACGNIVDIPLGQGKLIDLVISPNNSRVYATSEDYLHLINMDTREEVGTGFYIEEGETKWNVKAIELHSNGLFIYLAVTVDPNQMNAIWVIKTIELEKNLTNQEEIEITSISLNFDDNKREPKALAHSPVTNLLYLTNIAKKYINGEDVYSGELRVIDTTLQQLVNEQEFIPLDGFPKKRALAINRTGNMVAVLCYEIEKRDILNIIDCSNGKKFGGFPFYFNLTETTTALEFSVDGKYVFVAIKKNGGDKVVVIDIDKAERIQENFIPFNEEIKDLAIASPSGYLFAASSDDNNDNLTLIQTGVQEASEWEHTSGPLTPLKLPSPLSQAALFGVPGKLLNIASQATARSQVVPVSSGCTYHFEFLALACSYGSFAELFWIGDECTQLIQSEQVPIAVKDDDEFLLVTLENRNPLILHSIEALAPQGAVQAEIRFKVPAGNTALVDQVSFKVTDEKVTNKRLITKAGQLPQGWKLLSENNIEVELIDSRGFSLTQSDTALLIKNIGEETFGLMHSAEVIAGQKYLFQFTGIATSEANAQINPLIEILWLKEDDTESGPKITLEIIPGLSDEYSFDGTVPAESSKAEIYLWLPAQTALEISEISLRNFENIDVPITFIAQTPGEMVVSDLKVAYEIEEAEPPPVPEKGLCSATPPDRIPGQVPKDTCCCCSSCGAQSELIGAEYFETPAGRPAALASCSVCGSDMVHYGGAPVKGAKRLALKGNLSRFRKKAAAKPALLKPSLPKREPIPRIPGKPVFSAGAAKKKAVKEKPAAAPKAKKEKQPSADEVKKAKLAKEILGLAQDPIFEPLKTEKLSKILRLSPEKIYVLYIAR